MENLISKLTSTKSRVCKQLRKFVHAILPTDSPYFSKWTLHLYDKTTQQGFYKIKQDNAASNLIFIILINFLNDGASLFNLKIVGGSPNRLANLLFYPIVGISLLLRKRLPKSINFTIVFIIYFKYINICYVYYSSKSGFSTIT